MGNVYTTAQQAVLFYGWQTSETLSGSTYTSSNPKTHYYKKYRGRLITVTDADAYWALPDARIYSETGAPIFYLQNVTAEAAGFKVFITDHSESTVIGVLDTVEHDTQSQATVYLLDNSTANGKWAIFGNDDTGHYRLPTS